jgi:hypothetical protein
VQTLRCSWAMPCPTDILPRPALSGIVPTKARDLAIGRPSRQRVTAVLNLIRKSAALKDAKPKGSQRQSLLGWQPADSGDWVSRAQVPLKSVAVSNSIARVCSKAAKRRSASDGSASRFLMSGMIACCLARNFSPSATWPRTSIRCSSLCQTCEAVSLRGAQRVGADSDTKSACGGTSQPRHGLPI